MNLKELDQLLLNFHDGEVPIIQKPVRKSTDWFLYDRDIHDKKVKQCMQKFLSPPN